ncbi:MAG: hypothetical protein PHD48_11820, partial [Alphaproteobacteria bacterium]|nr:hypothetical protein [Alphaproteobacteria bacterium]
MAKSPPKTTRSLLQFIEDDQRPWDARHHTTHSEIEAYSETLSKWESIADVKGENHVAIAEYIVRAVNCQTKMQETIERLT